MLQSLLLWIFIACIAVQVGFVLFLFTRFFILFQKEDIDKNKRRHTTILICAKNEAHNLKKYLPNILTQDYTDEKGKRLFDVLVVNDASTDDSEIALKELKNQFPHLYSIHISPEEPRIFKGKKFALSKAVPTITSEWILMTDADCQPASNQWLSLMTKPFAEGKEIVCGYGAYDKAKGFLNGFIRWETLHTFLQYACYAKTGLPYMAVGRNLACTKDVLIKAQQSEIWNALPSGDDDLLIQICGTKENTAIVVTPDSFTFSEAKKTWKEWLHQKQRHLSTGKYYKAQTQFLLALYAFSHALFWLFFFSLLFTNEWKTVVILFFIRTIIYWVLWAAVESRLKEKRLQALMPLYDVSWALYNFVLSPFIFFKNKQQWK